MSRLSEAKRKYPSVNFDYWAKADPSKNGKYLSWIGLCVVNQEYYNYKQETFDSVMLLLKKFEKNQDKCKNFESYYTFASLQFTLDNLSESKKEIKDIGAIDIGAIDLGFHGDFQIIHLTNYKAAKLYCAGTKWYIVNEGIFKEYCCKSNIYVLIHQQTKTKLCLIISDTDDTIYSAKNIAFEIYDLFDFCKAFDINIKPAINKCENHYKQCKNPYLQIKNLYVRPSTLKDSINKTTFIKTLQKIQRKLSNEEIFDIIFKDSNTSIVNFINCIDFLCYFKEFHSIFQQCNKKLYCQVQYKQFNEVINCTVSKYWRDIDLDGGSK